MEYGYCRVSTSKQNPETQAVNIKAYSPNAVIVKEVFTGTKFQGRKELEKLLKNVKPGDTIIFDSVSRMSRDAEEGFKLYKHLFDKNINLVFLKEPHINTDTYKNSIKQVLQCNTNLDDQYAQEFLDNMFNAINKYMFRLAENQIRLAFEQSEKEVADLHHRTSDAVKKAKLDGKQVGQPKGAKLTTKKSIEMKEKIRKKNKTFGGTLNNEETYKVLNISRNTFYKYKNELLEEMAHE